MKKLVIAVLIFIGAADAAALYYLVQKQQKAQARLEESIQKDIDERWQIAQDVRKQVETNKQARDFIVRMDYDKQMEDYDQRLEGYKATLEELNKKSEERINALESSHNQLNELTKRLESESYQKFEGYKKELDALSKKNQEALDGLMASNKQIKEYLIKIESFFDRKVSSLEKQISKLSEELAAGTVKPESTPSLKIKGGI
jgi:uncharacterized coiled-coil protein SlyX